MKKNNIKFGYCDTAIAWLVSIDGLEIGMIHRDEGVWYWAQHLSSNKAPQLTTEGLLAIAEKMIALENP